MTNVASVTADISASSIRIGNKGDNGIFSFDIANYEHPMYESDLAVEVLPYKAKTAPTHSPSRTHTRVRQAI